MPLSGISSMPNLPPFEPCVMWKTKELASVFVNRVKTPCKNFLIFSSYMESSALPYIYGTESVKYCRFSFDISFSPTFVSKLASFVCCFVISIGNGRRTYVFLWNNSFLPPPLLNCTLYFSLSENLLSIN